MRRHVYSIGVTSHANEAVISHSLSPVHLRSLSHRISPSHSRMPQELSVCWVCSNLASPNVKYSMRLCRVRLGFVRCSKRKLEATCRPRGMQNQKPQPGLTNQYRQCPASQAPWVRDPACLLAARLTDPIKQDTEVSATWKQAARLKW